VQREAPIDARGLVEVVIHADLDKVRWRHLGVASSCRLIRNLRSSPGTRVEE
jgi:hypothetical protein